MGRRTETSGPTIEARQGEPVYVRRKNKLPDEHLLPVDTTIHSSTIPYDSTGVRVVTHLHGGNVEHTSDDKPEAWFTRDFEQTGPKFEKKRLLMLRRKLPGFRYAAGLGYRTVRRKEGITIELAKIDLERRDAFEYYSERHLDPTREFVEDLLEQAEAESLRDETDD